MGRLLRRVVFCTDPHNNTQERLVNHFLRNSTKMTKSRGRPKNYDPEVALDRALEAFWEGGFAATSLDALASATGMNRPSLYAAFGDKQSLYLKAMDRFSGGMREAVRGKLFNDGSLAEALTGFY